MFLRARPTEEVAEIVLDEFNDVKGVKEVVDGILALQENEIYEKLACVLSKKEDSRLDSGDFDELSELIRLASENMSKFPLSIPFAPLLTVKDVMIPYSFIYDLYSIRLDRDLTSKELYNIFYGHMATRILLMLENFDSNQKTPEPTKEFFKRLGKVKWQDKKAKKLFNHIQEIMFMLQHNKWKAPEGPSSSFRITEEAFVLLLSGCSAVIEGRDKINTFDVVRAKKMYLKLINTDISKLM